MHRTARRSFAPIDRLFVSVLVIAAAAATSAGAAAGPQGDWPARPKAASSEGFSVVQMATPNGQDFVREWNRPGPHGEVHGDSRVRPGQPIDTFIAFRGCRADPAGRCNVTAWFEITGPDGKSRASPPMDVWANQPQPKAGMIFLSRASLGLKFTATDPSGPYRIRAAVTDQVAGVTLHTQQVLTLLK
jgi:hypothetical protein